MSVSIEEREDKHRIPYWMDENDLYDKRLSGIEVELLSYNCVQELYIQKAYSMRKETGF